MPNHHEIKIECKDDGTVRPTEALKPMFTGDTVRYSSDEGTVTIVFPSGSPFMETTVNDSELVQVIHVGQFSCACKLQLKSGEMIGWDSNSPASGADHDVPH